MKQKLLLLLAVIAFLLPAKVSAQYVFESDGIYYGIFGDYDDNCNYTFTGAWVASSPDGNKYSGDLVIPSKVEYNGQELAVTSIGENAFYNCNALTSVKIPDSVISLESSAFASCKSLISIVIPESIIEIKDGAFSSCVSLTSIQIPNSVTRLGGGAFKYCTSLTNVKLSDSIAKLEYNTFGGCNALTSIIIPSSVTAIDNTAFSNCSSLKSIEIPRSVTSIGDSAFEGCSSLTSIVIPNSVNFIGNRAFEGCDNLNLLIILSDNVIFDTNVFSQWGKKPWHIFVPEGLDCSALNCSVRTFDPETTIILEDGTMLADDGKTLMFAPIYGGSDYAIPEGVTKVKTGAFCTMDAADTIIGTLTIPSSLEEIEDDVFNMYTKIDKVNFADWPKWYANVKLGNFYSNPYWNSKPFVGGVQMVTPELTEGMTEIPDYKNYGMQFRDEIELPMSIKRIGAYAFHNNKELYSVILPEGLEEIGESAFEGCELLENPSFPEGLKKIEDGAYKDCTTITEIALPEGVSTLGTMIPRDLIEVDAMGFSNYGKGVFQGCSSLEKAVLVADIDYLDDNLFRGCKKLYKVFLPNQLKTIGAYAFALCNSLDEVKFPSTLETIGEWAFAGQCNDNGYWDATRGSISQLVIPDNVTTLGHDAFYYQDISSLTLGKGLEIIPKHAFYNNPLKVINFSEGLKEIGERAFSYGGGDLGAVILPSTVTTIKAGAFNSTYVSELSIPDGVVSLEGDETCGRPSKLTLGSGIKNIAADAFNFERLYTIRLKAHMPPSLSAALPFTEDQNEKLTLIVNKDRHDTYNTNARWKQINRIIEDGDSEVDVYLDGTYSLAEEIRIQSGYMPSVITKMKVNGPLSENDLRVIKENMVSLTSLDLSEVTNLTAIPGHQFEGSLLTDISLPSNLESIGVWAFNYCRLLKLDKLPDSIKRIEGGAFSACPNVTISGLPASLEYLGPDAFNACIGIRKIVAGNSLSEIGHNAFGGCSLLESVDLSATSLGRLQERSFYNCHELDEIILPESLTQIDENAFAGTALRNIDFASGVATIGDGAFSDNRRLVTATLPESVTHVGSNLFTNCPRLISVSMPSATTNVGYNVLSNDKKLVNLSCAAVEAPEAETDAFNGIRYRNVTLTIPTLSFRKYLSAPQWGKFENMKNTIKVSMDAGVKVTNATEKEYQEMLKEDELEEAQEAAAAQTGEDTRARAVRRAAARAKSVQNFATMFDGAQLMSADGSANRVFITPDPDVHITSILFDDEELLPNFDGQSLLLPAGRSGSLKILTDATVENAVEMITSSEIGSEFDVYDMNGRMLMRSCSREQLNQFQPGIYILRNGNKVAKRVIK